MNKTAELHHLPLRILFQYGKDSRRAKISFTNAMNFLEFNFLNLQRILDLAEKCIERPSG